MVLPQLDLSVYDCTIEYFFTWYPVRESQVLPQPLMRGGKYRLSSGELGPGLGGGSSQGRWVVTAGPEDLVQVYLEIGVDGNGRMRASAMMAIGSAQASEDFDVPPKARIPYMLNLRADQHNEALAGTAAVLHGVIVTSATIGQTRLTEQL